LLSNRKPIGGDEQLDSIDKAARGVDISLRPKFWQPYELARDDILKRARSLDALYKQYPNKASLIDDALKKAGRDRSQAKFLPLQARVAGWSVLLDAQSALPIGYVPLDGFF
jgi:hypothetical protein